MGHSIVLFLGGSFRNGDKFHHFSGLHFLIHSKWTGGDDSGSQSLWVFPALSAHGAPSVCTASPCTFPPGTVLLLLPDPGAKDAQGVWKEGKKTARPDLEAAGGCQAEELGGPEGQAVYKLNSC